MTKTQEQTAPAGFAPVKDESRALPPLMILSVGDKVGMVLEDVVLVEDEDRPGKFRSFYRGLLQAEYEANDKEGKRQTFEKGATISVPGSGGLDFTLAGIARKAGKQGSKEDPKWQNIIGHYFIIERTEDETMAKGKHKGKPVKTYKVGHASPQK